MIYGTAPIITNGLVGYFDINNHKSYTSGSLFWRDLTGTCDIELTGSSGMLPILWNGINDSNQALVTLPYNACTFSETFGNSSWNKTKTGYSSSIVSNVIEGPPGLFGSGSKLNETTDNSKHLILKSINLPIGDCITFSFYAKAAERNWVYWENTDWAHASVSFNLLTGQIGSITNVGNVQGVNMNPFSASMEFVGDGWYRCAIRTFTGWDSVSHPIGVSINDTTRTYVGTSGSGIYIYGAQVDYGTILKPYKPVYNVSDVYNNSSFLKYTGSVIQANNDFSIFMWVRGHLNPGFLFSNLISKWSLSEGGFILYSTTTSMVHSTNTNLLQSINLQSLFGNVRPFTSYGWYQVGITRTEGRLNFYWNGILISNQIAINNSTSSSLEFGRGAGSGSNSGFESYPGIAYSNILIYNRALNQNEVLQNYNSMKTRYRQLSSNNQFGARTIFN